jgi:hypothetical protein
MTDGSNLVFLFMAAFAVSYAIVLTIGQWLRWRKLPSAVLAKGEILVSFRGTRIRLREPFTSQVDGRPLYWIGVDDVGGTHNVALDGFGWRSELHAAPSSDKL